MPDVLPGQKSDAANDNQKHHRDIHHRIAVIGGQRGKRRSGSHQVKACVTEGRDSVEHRQPDTAGALLRHKYRHQRQRAQQFKQENPFQDKAGKADNAAHLRRGNRILHGTALHQRDPFARSHGDCHGDGDNAHAANLNQQQNHHLAKKRPVGCRIVYNKARDANRRG